MESVNVFPILSTRSEEEHGSRNLSVLRRLLLRLARGFPVKTRLRGGKGGLSNPGFMDYSRKNSRTNHGTNAFEVVEDLQRGEVPSNSMVQPLVEHGAEDRTHHHAGGHGHHGDHDPPRVQHHSEGRQHHDDAVHDLPSHQREPGV